MRHDALLKATSSLTALLLRSANLFRREAARAGDGIHNFPYVSQLVQALIRRSADDLFGFLEKFFVRATLNASFERLELS